MRFLPPNFPRRNVAKPPADQRVYVPAGIATQQVATNDDGDAIRPTWQRVLGSAFGPPTETLPAYYREMDGPHFRIGRMVYPGIGQSSMRQGVETEQNPAFMTRIRPPYMPHRNATPASVRDAIIWVASQPNNDPVVMPVVPRR